MTDDREVVGTIHSMGWETDAETGAEVFYVHMRFAELPSLSPQLCWAAVPMSLRPAPDPAQLSLIEED